MPPNFLFFSPVEFVPSEVVSSRYQISAFTDFISIHFFHFPVSEIGRDGIDRQETN